MKNNVGKIEKILRVVVGIALIVGGIVVSGTTGIIMAGIGLVPLATGMLGNCPVYSIFKINTCKFK